MKIDFFVLRQLAKAANILSRRWEYKGFDFSKYLNHFQKGILQELDFK